MEIRLDLYTVSMNRNDYDYVLMTGTFCNVCCFTREFVCVMLDVSTPSLNSELVGEKTFTESVILIHKVCYFRILIFLVAGSWNKLKQVDHW